MIKISEGIDFMFGKKENEILIELFVEEKYRNLFSYTDSLFILSQK